jgi:hypothetical protein
MKSIGLLIIGLSMLIVVSALTPSDVVRKSEGSTEPKLALMGTNPSVFKSTPFAKTDIFQGKHFTTLPVDEATLSNKSALSFLNASEKEGFFSKITAQPGGSAVKIGSKLRLATTSVANNPVNLELNSLINPSNATPINTTINQTT